MIRCYNIAGVEILRFQAVSEFKNRSDNLRFSLVIDDEIRKILIATQPVRSG